MLNFFSTKPKPKPKRERHTTTITIMLTSGATHNITIATADQDVGDWVISAKHAHPVKIERKLEDIGASGVRIGNSFFPAHTILSVSIDPTHIEQITD